MSVSNQTMYQHAEVARQWMLRGDDIPQAEAIARLIKEHAELTAEVANLRDVIKQNCEVLGSAADCLRWYQDQHPASVSETDNEMLEQIDQAIQRGAP